MSKACFYQNAQSVTNWPPTLKTIVSQNWLHISKVLFRTLNEKFPYLCYEIVPSSKINNKSFFQKIDMISQTEPLRMINYTGK